MGIKVKWLSALRSDDRVGSCREQKAETLRDAKMPSDAIVNNV